MWNKLSMNDRAKYIQLGAANGITSLDTIRKVYNKYAEGGIIESNTEEALIDTAKGFIPIYGTYLDGVELYNNPSWENLGWFGMSLLSEIPVFKALKGLKAASKLKKASEALDAANNTYKRAIKQEARAHTQRLNRGVRSAKQDAVYDASKQVKRAKKEYNLLQSQVNNLVPDLYTPLYFTPNLLTEGIQRGLTPDNYNFYHRVE